LKKIIIITITVVFVGALLAIRISGNFQKPAIAEDAPINVKIAQAELTSIYATSPISGRVQPIEEVVIVPLASGEITRVNVKMGDKVSKGTVILEIDKTQVSTTYNKAKDSLNQAKTAYDRQSALYNEGAVSLQSLEQAETLYTTARESFTAASDAYNNCTVKSPINGYVTSLSAHAGGLASPSIPAATVADVSRLEINTTVSEYLIGKLKKGDTVEIYIATLGNEPFSGVIKALSPAPAVGGLTYPITISVEDPSSQVMAGMFAEIKIISDEKDKVLCIPSDAVIVKSGAPIVVVLNEENIPEFREIIPGIDNGEFVEITSGLSEGETIVTVGQQFVKEGVAVKIVE